MSRDQLSLAARAKKFGAAEGEGIVRCDACPVLCRIRPGRAGACARYANENGQLVRTDPVLLMQRTLDEGGKLAPFAGSAWDGAPLDPARTFVTGVGAGTTYPDYKPAPFIVSAQHDGVDTVTVVTDRKSTRLNSSHQSVSRMPYHRSEERRVGKECQSVCRSRWSPYH